MDDQFAADLLDKLPADVASAMQRAEQATRPQASLHTRSGSKNDVGLSDFTDLLEGSIETVLVIEDVNLTWMEAVGESLKIDPSFFVDHAQDIGSRDPWTAIMGSTPTQTAQELRGELYNSVRTTDQARYWHLSGIFTSHAFCNKRVNCQPRPTTWTKQYGWNTATRLSLWTRDRICLILVDAPASEAPLVLHLPVSNNRGGLIIPQLYGEHYSIYECIHCFLSHPWHFHVIFSDHGISPMSFGYVLALSTWQTKLREFDSKVKYVSFEEIRKPTVQINNKLHDLRRDLDGLRKEVSRTRDWVPEAVRQELSRIKEQTTKHVALLDSALEQILVESSILEKFLMDSFTLLLGSISVQEAEISAKTSERTQQLTTLAFIYVPLSFVTGIFGMNINEINGSLVPAWVPVATLGVTLSLTAVTFATAYLWQQNRRAQTT